jgi:phosphoribosylformylglycinamidine synthase
MTNTVVAPGAGDAAVIRIKGTARGLAFTTDCNARWCELDPQQGGAAAVAEAARNLVCVGAEPLAVTNCLNFGNPERPEIFYQMEGCVAGMTAACTALGTPVVSGNVSLYNETEGRAVLPTPVVGMVGLLDDVEQRVTMAWPAGATLLLLQPALRPTGRPDGADLLGASEYVATVLGVAVGNPPPVDLDDERRVQTVALAAIRAGLVLAAHDCSDGGLAVAIAEGCIVGGTGVTLEPAALTGPAPDQRWDVRLFAEQASRIVLACRPGAVDEIARRAGAAHVTAQVLGTTGGDRITCDRVLDLSLAETEAAWRNAI